MTALSDGFAPWLATLAASRPFQGGPAEPTIAPGSGPLGELFAYIAVQQAAFYRALTAALDRFAADPSAGWLLVGLSLAYGIFHAAGPGHGKAVISAYVVAERRTAVRAVALSFAAALVQATTAVVLVVAATEVLRLTSVSLNRTTGWIETGSYALITAIGAVLVWQKMLRPVLATALQRAPAGAGPAAQLRAHGHAHDHAHTGCGHDHAHAVDPAALAAPGGGIRKEALIALSVGVRPCSGAIIVLVFALTQGLAPAGIASAYAMAVGTGTTVAALAILALGARGLAERMFRHRPAAAVIFGVLEALAASAILVIGVLLLGASLS